MPDKPAFSDSDLLDYLDGLPIPSNHGWLVRPSSTGRGWRLLTTMLETAHQTAREAIVAAMIGDHDKGLAVLFPGSQPGEFGPAARWPEKVDTAPVSIPAIDPGTLESSGFEMSNFDGQIPERMAEAMIAGSRGDHPARDHYGEVWYEQGLFWERVKQYRTVVGVHSAATLQELFDQVNAQYGDR